MQVKSKSGFTLTEILFTVIVIGTLAGLSLPKIANQIEKVKSVNNIPVVILTHVEGNDNPKWIEWQKDFLNLSPSNSKQMLCKTGHNIQIENPDLVVETVLELVEKIRNPQ